jgi:cold-inducible RNA-binding protein
VTNIFIGSLDVNATEEQLRILFATYGAVETVTIVKDRDTGKPRGFAFVEMTEAAEAQ